MSRSARALARARSHLLSRRRTEEVAHRPHAVQLLEPEADEDHGLSARHTPGTHTLNSDDPYQRFKNAERHYGLPDYGPKR